jgi:hypothetical protein
VILIGAVLWVDVEKGSCPQMTQMGADFGPGFLYAFISVICGYFYGPSRLCVYALN